VAAQPKPDFFISYNKADRGWAEWIAWELEDIGYLTVLQVWDFRPGHNFVLDMQQSMASAERTLAVLSADFLKSLYCQPEWAAAFAADPTGAAGKLLPVRVGVCKPEGLLAQLNYIDLVGLAEDEARVALRAGVQRGRAKPLARPSFPGKVVGSPQSRPPSFPGPTAAPFPSAPATAHTSAPPSVRQPGKRRTFWFASAALLLLVLLVLGTIAASRHQAPTPESLDADLGLPAADPPPQTRTHFELSPELSWLTSAAWTPGGHGLILIGDSPAKPYLYSMEGRRLEGTDSHHLDVLQNQAPAYIAANNPGYILYSKEKDSQFLDLLELDQHLKVVTKHPVEATSSSTADLHLTGLKDWVIAGKDIVAIGDMGLGDLEDRDNVKWMSWLIRFPLDAPAHLTKIDEIAHETPLPYVYRMVYPHLAALGERAYFLKMHSADAPTILNVADKNWLGPGVPTHLGFQDFEGTPPYSGHDKMEAYRAFEATATAAAIYGWKGYLYLLLKCATQDAQPTRWFLTKLEPHMMKPLYTVSIPADSPHLTIVPGDFFWAFIEKDKPYVPPSGHEAQRVSHLIVVPAAQIESKDSALVVQAEQPRCGDGARWNPEALLWEKGPGF